ncbi:MAG: apolipoprotein N-acyltransferase [Nitrospirota bacterium]
MLCSKKIITLALLSGMLLALSFPRWNFPWLAFIAVIPLFYASEGQTPKKSFLLGWIAGMVYFAGSLSWVTISMEQYGGLSKFISFPLMFLLSAYLSLYVAFFTGLLRLFKSDLSWAMAPVFWTGLEYLRGHLLTGFPWNILGYSQYRNISLIQIADITSVYGVSFMIILINVSLYLIAQTAWQKRQLAIYPTAILFSVLAISFLYGTYRLSQPMGRGDPITVAVIQGNIDQSGKWSPNLRETIVAKYERLSRTFSNRADLVVWPEAALPVFFQNEPLYQERLGVLSRRGNFSLLFGSPAFLETPLGQISLLNSAYLLSGGSAERYDKIHLVPFGEYVPLKSLLFFVDKMVTGIGEFIPGETAKVFEMSSAKIGTAICFEVIFPEVVRRFAQNGANLMVTITNDAWFGDSAAPDQHFSMVVFRAIENRVPFARAANTGISGFIDAHGKILQTSPLFKDAALLHSLSLGMRKTIYTRHGDFFAIGNLLIMMGFMIWVVLKKK